MIQPLLWLTSVFKSRLRLCIPERFCESCGETAMCLKYLMLGGVIRGRTGAFSVLWHRQGQRGDKQTPTHLRL